jgi:hypothetical protein
MTGLGMRDRGSSRNTSDTCLRRSQFAFSRNALMLFICAHRGGVAWLLRKPRLAQSTRGKRLLDHLAADSIKNAS